MFYGRSTSVVATTVSVLTTLSPFGSFWVLGHPRPSFGLTEGKLVTSR
jgi:hypothetical protein